MMTTTASRDALDVGSVVLDGSGWAIAWVKGENRWYSTLPTETRRRPILPATLLHPDPDADLLAELARCTATPEECRARIANAVTIAKAGGIDDRTLEALLHLANVRAMTSTAERALRDVGINPEPWGPQ